MRRTPASATTAVVAQVVGDAGAVDGSTSSSSRASTARWRRGAFGDELVEVVGLGGSEFPHAEVIEDQHYRPGELAEPLVPGVVGVLGGAHGSPQVEAVSFTLFRWASLM